MGFLGCFGSSSSKRRKPKRAAVGQRASKISSEETVKETLVPEAGASTAKTFTYRELAAATNNFAQERLLGEGGFGGVYRGNLESTGQVVAVKQLERRNGHQGNKEFLVEVLMLDHLYHPNLVYLVGYCADGNHRLLVYEFMPLGSLADHLHDLPSDKEPLDWYTRMKIAAGAAEGLEYLHDTVKPAVIHRDMKSSNILLDQGYHPKLSDFGMAKLGPVGDATHVSTQVMGTLGYCAPEYIKTGQLTIKTDIYCFGVVILELITGRRAIDNSRIRAEQNLVSWAKPMFKDRKKFPQMADPLLQGRYPTRGFYQAIAVAAMCLQDPAIRPDVKDVVTALSYLASEPCDINAAQTQHSKVVPSPHKLRENQNRLSDRADGHDHSGSGGKHASHSPKQDLPKFRQRDHVQD